MLRRSTILSAIAAFMLLGSPATANALPDSAHLLQARDTCGISIQAACNYFHGVSSYSKTIGSRCTDWVCVTGSTQSGLDLDAWCIHVYGSNARATCSGGAYNWGCHY